MRELRNDVVSSIVIEIIWAPMVLKGAVGGLFVWARYRFINIFMRFAVGNSIM
jgi:hypothetical protein